MCSRESDDHPLSGEGLWGRTAPLFLTRTEERRIKSLGRDPWAQVL
ncbi:hypothetical protein ABZ467_28065 [Streptomyces sp. NPDC005727]